MEHFNASISGYWILFLVAFVLQLSIHGYGQEQWVPVSAERGSSPQMTPSTTNNPLSSNLSSPSNLSSSSNSSSSGGSYVVVGGGDETYTVAQPTNVFPFLNQHAGTNNSSISNGRDTENSEFTIPNSSIRDPDIPVRNNIGYNRNGNGRNNENNIRNNEKEIQNNRKITVEFNECKDAEIRGYAMPFACCSIKDGDFLDPSIWHCGRVPTMLDSCFIRHFVRISDEDQIVKIRLRALWIIKSIEAKYKGKKGVLRGGKVIGNICKNENNSIQSSMSQNQLLAMRNTFKDYLNLRDDIIEKKGSSTIQEMCQSFRDINNYYRNDNNFKFHQKYPAIIRIDEIGGPVPRKLALSVALTGRKITKNNNPYNGNNPNNANNANNPNNTNNPNNYGNYSQNSYPPRQEYNTNQNSTHQQYRNQNITDEIDQQQQINENRNRFENIRNNTEDGGIPPFLRNGLERYLPTRRLQEGEHIFPKKNENNENNLQIVETNNDIIQRFLEKEEETIQRLLEKADDENYELENDENDENFDINRLEKAEKDGIIQRLKHFENKQNIQKARNQEGKEDIEKMVNLERIEENLEEKKEEKKMSKTSLKDTIYRRLQEEEMILSKPLKAVGPIVVRVEKEAALLLFENTSLQVDGDLRNDGIFFIGEVYSEKCIESIKNNELNNNFNFNRKLNEEICRLPSLSLNGSLIAAKPVNVMWIQFKGQNKNSDNNNSNNNDIYWYGISQYPSNLFDSERSTVTFYGQLHIKSISPSFSLSFKRMGFTLQEGNNDVNNKIIHPTMITTSDSNNADLVIYVDIIDSDGYIDCCENFYDTHVSEFVIKGCNLKLGRYIDFSKHIGDYNSRISDQIVIRANIITTEQTFNQVPTLITESEVVLTNDDRPSKKAGVDRDILYLQCTSECRITNQTFKQKNPYKLIQIKREVDN